MIVIDVGCATHGASYSIGRLRSWYRPDVLYGFDPHDDGVDYPDDVRVEHKAAWVHDGTVGYVAQGTTSHVTDGGDVPCVDLARFIHELPDDTIVLKVDAEGAEYPLLRHLIDRGADERLCLALVEWHQPDMGRDEITAALRCPTGRWIW